MKDKGIKSLINKQTETTVNVPTNKYTATDEREKKKETITTGKQIMRQKNEKE